MFLKNYTVSIKTAILSLLPESENSQLNYKWEKQLLIGSDFKLLSQGRQTEDVQTVMKNNSCFYCYSLEHRLFPRFIFQETSSAGKLPNS